MLGKSTVAGDVKVHNETELALHRNEVLGEYENSMATDFPNESQSLLRCWHSARPSSILGKHRI